MHETPTDAQKARVADTYARFLRAMGRTSDAEREAARAWRFHEAAQRQAAAGEHVGDPCTSRNLAVSDGEAE